MFNRVFSFLRRSESKLSRSLVGHIFPSTSPNYVSERLCETVDCFLNPWDLRPAINAIMEAQNWILDRLPPHKPLVILIGERHDHQTHALLQQAVLENLYLQNLRWRKRTFAFGFEAAHNFVSSSLGTVETDFHGQAIITGFNAIAEKQEELVSHYADTFKFCLRNNISVQFNDIASKRNDDVSIIDQTDAFSRKIIEKYAPNLLSKEILRSHPSSNLTDGVMLSNHAIVENAIAHMRSTRAKIYVQHAGTGHIAGYTPVDVRYNDSLCMRFMEQGFAVLPIIPRYEIDKNYIPEDANQILKHSIRIENMAQSSVHKIDYESVKRLVNRNSSLNL